MTLNDNAALISIDVQRSFDLPKWGRRNNPAMEDNGQALLAAWRRARRPVVIVRHDSVRPGTSLFPGQPGNALKPGFEPQGDEPLVAKNVNSAFIGTSLEAWLRERGIGQVVLFGICTDMCVSTTARMAANLGFETIIAGDACHTFDQTAPDGTLLTAEELHRAHLTTLHTEFGRVVDTATLVAAVSADSSVGGTI